MLMKVKSCNAGKSFKSVKSCSGFESFNSVKSFCAGESFNSVKSCNGGESFNSLRVIHGVMLYHCNVLESRNSANSSDAVPLSRAEML